MLYLLILVDHVIFHLSCPLYNEVPESLLLWSGPTFFTLLIAHSQTTWNWGKLCHVQHNQLNILDISFFFTKGIFWPISIKFCTKRRNIKRKILIKKCTLWIMIWCLLLICRFWFISWFCKKICVSPKSLGPHHQVNKLAYCMDLSDQLLSMNHSFKLFRPNLPPFKRI